MKTLNYLILGMIVFMVMGMAKVPPTPPPYSYSYNQQMTNFINAIINTCVSDCTKTSNEADCSDLCLNDTMDAVERNRNAIINKFGNVL